MIRGERVHAGWIAALAGVAGGAAASAVAIAGALVAAPTDPASQPHSDHAADAAPPPSPPDVAALRGGPPLPNTAAPAANAPAPGAARDNLGARAERVGAPCPDAIGLRFAYGDTVPPPDAAATLGPILVHLAAHPGATVIVDGHADPTGDDATNLALSRRRAHRVAELLIQTGADRARVVERAFGAYVPLVGEDGAALRRVRVAIHDRSCEQEDPP